MYLLLTLFGLLTYACSTPVVVSSVTGTEKDLSTSNSGEWYLVSVDGNSKDTPITTVDGWEYRGVYGSVQLFVATENHADIHRFAASGRLLNCSRKDKLWVLQFRHSSSNVTVDPSPGRVLFQNSELILLEGALDNFRSPQDANLIPVATSKVRPVKSKQQVLGARNINTQLQNPAITDALRYISSDSLHQTVEHLASYHTRLATSGEAVEAEIWLLGELVRLGFEVSTFGFEKNQSSNVIATKKGTKFPDQFVIAGAHYDSRGSDRTDRTERAPGADDNGTGSAAVLELAKLISALDMAFEYSLQLCFFSGEELGLLGSRAYAKHLADTGVDVIAMFNSDMLGWKPEGTEYIVGMKDQFVSDWLLEAANSITELYVPRLLVGTSPSCCSDQQSFTENGFPAIGYFEQPGPASDNPHYHSSTDLPQYLDKENHLLITQAMISSVLTFAVPDETNN